MPSRECLRSPQTPARGTGLRGLMRQYLPMIQIILCAVSAALAQSDRGTVTGTVTDPAKAAVPGAKVAARNTETGALFETVTTTTGNYTITSLPVGSYDLTVEAPGFSRKVQQGIRIQVAQTARI